jgi:Tfp pilus assembly protein PilX
VITFVIVALMALCGAFLHLSMIQAREQQNAEDSVQALYAAEAGISLAIIDLDDDGNGNLGSAAAPRGFATGSFYTTTVDNGDNTCTITSTASVGRTSRRVERIMRKTSDRGNEAGPRGSAVQY